MKLYTYPEGIGFDGKIICGSRTTCVGPNGAYLIRFFCGRWSCPDCRQRMTDEHVNAITRSFLPKVQVFVGHRMETGPALRKILRDVDSYWCILCNDGAVIISSRKFPGAERRDKNKFLHENLRGIFDKAWLGGKRVSHSKDFNKLPNPRKNEPLYAIVPGNKIAEYGKLINEEERAYWLAGLEDGILRKPGKELIKKHVQTIPADASIVDAVTAHSPETRKELQHAKEQ